MGAMAAGEGGWLGPAFRLRLLLATVLQAVSVGHLRHCPAKSRKRYAGKRRSIRSALGAAEERAGGWASLGTAVAGMRRGVIPGCFCRHSSDFRLFWVLCFTQF
jgi:hypothetical protein